MVKGQVFSSVHRQPPELDVQGCDLSYNWSDNLYANGKDNVHGSWLMQNILNNANSQTCGQQNYYGGQSPTPMPVQRNLAMHAAPQELLNQQGDQASPSNRAMWLMMQHLPSQLDNAMSMPEQAVLLGCTSPAHAFYQGGGGITAMSVASLPTQTATSMTSLPTVTGSSMSSLPPMAALSMESLPVMPVQRTGSHPCAVQSMGDLPMMSAQAGSHPCAVNSMGDLPMMSMQEVQAADRRPYAVNSVGDLPMMSIQAAGGRPYAVNSVGELPMMSLHKAGNQSFAVNSMGAVPCRSNQKQVTRGSNHGGYNTSAAEETPQRHNHNWRQILGLPLQSKNRSMLLSDRSQKLEQLESDQLCQQEGYACKNAVHGDLSKSAAQMPTHKKIMENIKARASQQLMSQHVEEPTAADPKSDEQASVDPVLMELENADPAKVRGTLQWVLSSVWPLTLTRRGTRILQKAVEVGTPSDQLDILRRLEGHVQEAMRSPHGNYVLQKCIEVVAPERVQFMLDELKGSAIVAARHRFGCRILQRLIEHCPQEQTEDMVSEVLGDVNQLCRHQFGNYVIQHILQHGSHPHKKCIADALCKDVIRLAKHRVASHVVSCAMVHCATEDVQRLTQVVLADAGQLADLSRREYGSFVVREVNRIRRLHG